MPTYKLSYFNSRGRAEICRLIFAQAGVQYEDCRLTGEEWQKFKPNTPYGGLPVLEIDGKMLAGSVPIARFLAEEFGLAGSNAIENAELAGIVDFLGDLAIKVLQIYLEKDETKRADLKKDLTETHVPRFFGILEKQIAENGSGWVFGSKITYADLCITETVGFVNIFVENVLEKYSKIAKLNEDVNALPRISEWIKTRPKTDH